MEVQRPAFLLEIPPSSERPNSLAARFLDPQAFQPKSQHQLNPKVKFRVTPYVTATIGDAKAVAVEYFQKIHWWMPIISSKRFFDSMLNPITEPESELPVLVLAMKVILWKPSKQQTVDPMTEEYIAAKHAITEAISVGVLSLYVLQAQILLALFELGHATYPAAYLSIAACAQYGTAIGVEDSLDPDYEANNTFIGPLEAEERRRAWWAILILDRFVHLGNSKHRLSTEEAKGESLLPLDDENFDQGNTSGTRFPVSAAADTKMGSFARMSQASHLLARVLRYNQYRSEAVAETDEQAEYWQLDRTIKSLINLSYLEGEIRRTAVCGQTSICFSALLALHDPHQSRTDPSHQQFTVDLLRPIADTMAWDSDVFLSGHLVSVQDASPLLVRWAYDAGAIYNRLASYYDTDSLQYLHRMKEKLGVMSQRWLSAGVYLELLDTFPRAAT